VWVEGKGRVVALPKWGEGMDLSALAGMKAEECFSQQKYLLMGLFPSSHSGGQFPAFCSFSLIEANMDSP